jgi:hypothetical protein
LSYQGPELTTGATPRRRPAAVTTAALALIVMATVGLADAVCGLVTLAGTVDRYRSAQTVADRADVDATVAVVRGLAVVALVLAVLAAALLVGLAVGLLRGSGGARVATWVVCGLGLLLGCGGLVAVVAQRAVPLRLGADGQSRAQTVGAVTDAYPHWWVGLGAALSAAQMLSYLVVAGLLALPAANAYLRRRTPVPQPATPPAPSMSR